MADMTVSALFQRVQTAEANLAEAQRQAQEDRKRFMQAQAELKAQMQGMVSSFNQSLRQMQQELYSALEESEAAHEAAMRDMEARRAALEDALRREREAREREREMAARAASAALTRAKDALNAVRELPCEFFAAGNADAIRAQLDRAAQLCDDELTQASAAMAESAATDAVALGARVRQAQREWEQIFGQYQALVAAIVAERKRFVAEPFGREEQPISEDDRAYWSGGEWTAHSADVDALDEDLTGMDVMRNGENTLRVPQLLRAMSRAGRIGDRQQALMDCIRRERRLSDERYYTGQALLEPLGEKGFTVVDCGFADDAPLESYDIVLSLPARDGEDVVVSVVPIRVDGVAVRNEIVARMAKPDRFSVEMIHVYLDSVASAARSAAPGMKINGPEPGKAETPQPHSGRMDPRRQVLLYERRNH